MCKTLHYTWLVVNLLLGIVDPMEAMPTPEILPLQWESTPSGMDQFFPARPESMRSRTKAFLSPHLLDSVESYLAATDDPFDLSPVPQLFIEELQNRATISLIRNGDLDELETDYQSYQYNLTRLHLFSKRNKIPIRAKRRTECRIRNCSHSNWNSFHKLREQTLGSFNDFQLALLNAYQTERLIWAQYRHNPALYQAINSLINLNGEPLPVYVQTRHSLFHEDPALLHLKGMLVVSLKEGIFSSNTPFIRKYHPSFVGRSGAIAVFLDSEADGATLSHEFGHLYYLYHHWESYMKFIAKQGEHYQIGGHGVGDCSGKAANLAEAGKMPNLFMPWAYRRQWSRGPQPLVTLAEE